MDYTIIRAKSQEEILEILSHNVTSREKDLDEGRLIQERKKKEDVYTSSSPKKSLKTGR